ncbi:MAG: methylamine utilization protein [Gammaproteobacteria bacterium]|nr:methylamine utilization protein [Gammaproteobacteria bacterium]
MACTVLAAPGIAVAAAALSVTVLGADGRPVEGAVVLAEPVAPAPRPAAGLRATMDQRNLMFVPDVLVVQTGTAVDFPNSDQVRHQVYSFSSAKTFQLALYAGRAHAPVVFDHPGLVTLGCNIHDGMVGYIWVTDSPWFGRTSASGTLQLRGLAPGEYQVRIWHSRLAESGPQLRQQLSLADGATASAGFRLRQLLKPPLMNHGADKKWADY